MQFALRSIFQERKDTIRTGEPGGRGSCENIWEGEAPAERHSRKLLIQKGSAGASPSRDKDRQFSTASGSSAPIHDLRQESLQGMLRSDSVQVAPDCRTRDAVERDGDKARATLLPMLSRADVPNHDAQGSL